MVYFSCVAPCIWFGVFKPSFILPQYPSSCETVIARPTESRDNRINSHLMWNKELMTLDYFSHVPALDLEVFWPSFPKLPQYLSTCETGITRPTVGPATRTRSHLMWNKQLKTLDYFSCVPAHDYGVFGTSFPKLPQYLCTCETGIIQPTQGLDTSIRPHLMWDFFSSDSVLDLGVGTFPQIVPMPKHPKNRYNSIVRLSWQKSKTSFDVTWDFTLVLWPSVGRAIPVSQVLRYWGNLGKLGLNTPNHMQGHIKSNPKSSDPHFTSNETLL